MGGLRLWRPPFPTTRWACVEVQHEARKVKMLNAWKSCASNCTLIHNTTFVAPCMSYRHTVLSRIPWIIEGLAMCFVLLKLVVSFLLDSMRALSGARTRLHYDRILLEPHPKCRSQFARSCIARSCELAHVETRPQQGHVLTDKKKITFLF